MIWPSSPAVKTVCSWSKTQKLRTSSEPWAPGSPTLVSALKPHAGDLAMCTSWKSCWLFPGASLSASSPEQSFERRGNEGGQGKRGRRKKRGRGNLLLRAGPYDSAHVAQLRRDVGDVLAPEGGADVPHGPGGVAALAGLGNIVQGEPLVVADGVDLGGVEEARTVDGAVVEGLDDDLVLVGDGRVADVDEPVGGAREEDLGRCRVEV